VNFFTLEWTDYPDNMLRYLEWIEREKGWRVFEFDGNVILNHVSKENVST
jgi:hypothetical protein